jgi:hypothetical protein
MAVDYPRAVAASHAMCDALSDASGTIERDTALAAIAAVICSLADGLGIVPRTLAIEIVDYAQSLHDDEPERAATSRGGQS